MEISRALQIAHMVKPGLAEGTFMFKSEEKITYGELMETLVLLREWVPCPGVEIDAGAYSGCTGTGGDCPICGE